MWFLKYHSYFQFWQKEIWWHHLICSGIFFKHQFRSAQLTRDGVADERLLCNPAHALLRQRSEQPMQCCPDTCVQNHDHCTKPLPHSSSLDLELQTSTLDHPRLSTAVLDNIHSWTADTKKHLPDIDLPGGSIPPLHVSWEAACPSMGHGSIQPHSCSLAAP